MYEVMSPYDTATVMIYADRFTYSYDTIYYKSCENTPLKIHASNLFRWYDGSTDTLKNITQSGEYWYEEKMKCKVNRHQVYAIISSSYSDTISHYDCKPYSWIDSIYHFTGKYNKEYYTIVGCDSTISLDLTIGINSRVKLDNGIHYTAHCDDCSYQWFRCYPWQRIANETSQKFTTHTRGSYAVVLTSTDGECKDTSDCIALYSSSIADIDDKGIKIYPNPTKSSLTIAFPNVQKHLAIKLNDLSGRVLKSQDFQNEKEIILSVKDIAKGVYYLQVASDEGVKFVNVKRE